MRYNKNSIFASVSRYLGHNITTCDGIRVSSISIHAAEQAQERKVSRKAILDATERSLYIGPVKTDTAGRKSKQYLGKSATVCINPDTGAIVTIWRTGSKRAQKHMKRE